MSFINNALKMEGRKLSKPKKTKGVQESKAVQIEYYKKLKLLTNELKRSVREEVIPYLEQNERLYKSTKDGYADDLVVVFERLRNKFFNITSFANSTASEMVSNTDKKNKDKLYRSVNNAIGIDFNQVIAEEGLEDFTKSQIQKNATLIKSIPEDFFKEIETIVYNGVSEGKSYKNITKQITGIKNINSTFGKLEKRIKLIARNETSTINSQITKKRYENLGIKRAIWRTSLDERTRPCHRAREGKEYDLAVGLYSSCDGKTLQVGIEINCRCYSEGIIEFD